METLDRIVDRRLETVICTILLQFSNDGDQCNAVTTCSACNTLERIRFDDGDNAAVAPVCFVEL